MLPFQTIDAQMIGLVLIAVVVLVAIYTTKRRVAKSNSAQLPPGPPGHWLFGNDIPKVYAYRAFETLTQEYGPVFTLQPASAVLSLFTNAPVMVVIGRIDAAIAILEKEGAVTVDRPANIAAGETLSGGMRMLLTRSGERFRKMRRALHAHMQQKVTLSYAPVQQRNAKTFLLDIIDDPAHHQDHAKLYSAAVVTSLAYGTTVNSYEDPTVQSVLRCLLRLADNLRPGLWKVEMYPWLRYVPGYLKELKEGHAEELSLFKGELDSVRQRMATNSAPPSFGRYLLEQQHDTGLSDDEIAYLAGSMFGAGSDTTASAISITILAAITHPAAQARVQEELDLVVGRDRAPTFADEAMLPQATAFMLESFRWRPVSAGGFAHRATKDIQWKNYVIPAGASVIGNIWSIGRDPEMYPNPETFNPQRWLNDEGQLRDDMKLFNFGFGRRICPGQHIASRSVFINLILTHWAFTMSPDSSRGPIDVLAFTEGANTHPMPFGVVFEPRIEVGKIRQMLEGYELSV